MARKPKTNGDDTATKGHNVKELYKVIRECAQEMNVIRRERQALNERAGDIRKRVKDHGIQTGSFDFAVKQAEREPEARASYLDGIRLSFEALGIGGQGDMFPPKSESGEGAEPENDVEDRKAQCFDAGKTVALAGGDRDDMDFAQGSQDGEDWQAGWDAGKAEQTQPAAG